MLSEKQTDKAGEVECWVWLAEGRARQRPRWVIWAALPSKRHNGSLASVCSLSVATRRALGRVGDTGSSCDPGCGSRVVVPSGSGWGAPDPSPGVWGAGLGFWQVGLLRPLPGCPWCLLLCLYVGTEGQEGSSWGSSSSKGTNPTRGPHPHALIISNSITWDKGFKVNGGTQACSS